MVVQLGAKLTQLLVKLFPSFSGLQQEEASQQSDLGDDSFGNDGLALHELHERVLHRAEVEHPHRRLHARQRLRAVAARRRHDQRKVHQGEQVGQPASVLALDIPSRSESSRGSA